MHVVSSLEIGGQERVVLDLARGLVARGHRVTVVSLAEGGALRPAFGPIPTVSVPRGTRGIDALLPFKLAQLFATLQPDVIHTHNPSALFYGGLAARARGLRLVHTKHGANPTDRVRTLAARRLTSRLCHEIVAVSEETALIARKRDLIPAAHLHVITNGIDVDAFRSDPAARDRVRAELRIPGESVVIGTVGRLAAEKNQRLLVDAVGELLGPGVFLVLVGDGPERSLLERAVPHDRAPFVRFAGARSDVPALMSAFDIFVLSSRTEGLPLVVPEAMAASLPVVCTAVGGLPSVIRNGVTGLLVPTGERAPLTAALRQLIGDPARRARLGAAAREDAKRRFAMGRMVEAYLALYQGI